MTPYVLSARASLAPREEIDSRIAVGPKTNAARAAKLAELFSEAGCVAPYYREQVVRPGRPPNLICDLPGERPGVIVVGGHYDKVSEGDGVADNWSGASLLPTLYAGLASTPRRHSYRFIAFTDEELGLVGSIYYVRSLGRSPRRTINAMVNLDVLGLDEASAWLTHADRALYVALGRTALALETKLRAVEIGDVSTDSEAFRIRRIPSITITSIDPENLDLINGPNDTLDLIDLDRYYATYRLVASFLLVLDDRLDDPEFGKE